MSEYNAPPTDPRWRHAHDTAEALRGALRMLGLPESELTTLSLRADATGAPLVTLPPLRPESAETVLSGLGPSVGPQGPRLVHALQHPAP